MLAEVPDRPLHGRAFGPTLAPLLGYSVFAAAWLGRGVLLHPEARVFGDRFPDKTIVMWSFLWWPHEIVHGHDPFVTKAIWAPHGIDLAWATAVPGLSLLLTPFSETLGPVFAYNLAALAAPPLAAWTAYLLARRLTRSVPASLLAGFLFGFSPYVMGEASSHLNLSFVCLVPVVGLLATRFVQDDLGPWAYAGLLALTLGFQFYVSTEVFATLTLVSAICLALAFALLPWLRDRLRRLVGFTAVGYLGAGLLALPYLLQAFAEGAAAPFRGVIPASVDLANLVVPTPVTWLRLPGSDSIVQHFASNGAEQGAYLGIPLLLVLALAAVGMRGRSRRGVLLLLLSAGVVTILALGPRVRIDGHELGTGPWTWIEGLPAIHDALPIRLDMYTALFGALAAALWLARPGAVLSRFGLVDLAVVALLPAPSGARWTSDVPQSSFFSAAAYRADLGVHDTALVLPYGPTGWSMLWQAESGFRFATVGGWIGRAVTAPECRWYWDYRALIGVSPPGGGAAFRRFLLAHHVTVVVEGPGTQRWAKRLVAAALPDVRPVRISDAVVLRLPPGLPAALPTGAPALPPAARPQQAPSGLPCTVPPYRASA